MGCCQYASGLDEEARAEDEAVAIGDPHRSRGEEVPDGLLMAHPDRLQTSRTWAVAPASTPPKNAIRRPVFTSIPTVNVNSDSAASTSLAALLKSVLNSTSASLKRSGSIFGSNATSCGPGGK